MFPAPEHAKISEDTDPPRTEIMFPAPEHAKISEDTALSVRFRGHDHRDQTAPEDLLFAWRLDSHGWSPLQNEKLLVLAGLGLGHHVLQIRALDRNGNFEIIPATLEFDVLVPWYRENRFVAVLALALAISLFFAGLALNRHHRLRNSYALVEQLVGERTRQLELANRELLHSQKMNALGVLAAGIAHDFNNILSIIKGSTQIIEANPGDEEKIRTRVDRIKKVVQQGAEVVEALLGFSRGSEGAPAPININPLVGETKTLLGDRFLRQTEVRFECADNLPEIAVPRDFVQQILLNFIFNAAEAMETPASSAETSGPKHIRVKTRLSRSLPAELALSPANAAQFVLISVEDHGCGIPPEIKPRIFEPFFTTKSLSTRRGTGLGLSMVYELAKKIGAGLAVDSQPGVGSEFILILPLQT
jgi:signal transduction histidine kinase